jgi:tripartite-type tricarboxylate transporter receptor subunit TctC
MLKVLRALALIAVSLLVAGGAVRAQDAYPGKPVRVIVPFPPGGPADLIARLIGQKLSEGLGKQFYIENHSGAGGNLGTGIAARAPGDGYTIMITSQALVINTSLYKSLPYDPTKDFVAVTRIATTPNVLVVNPDVPAKTVKELVELIRKEPAKYGSYAQPGIGTPAHLSGELFKLSEHLNLTSVPFGGGGPMVQSVVAGHTPIAFSSLAPAAALIQGGKIRALAVTAEKRDASLPDVPTMAEAGYPNQIGETPIGILVPAGAPKPVIDILHNQVVQILKDADVRTKLAAIGFTPIGGTPAEFATLLHDEGVKWAKVIKDAGITPQ